MTRCRDLGIAENDEVPKSSQQGDIDNPSVRLLILIPDFTCDNPGVQRRYNSRSSNDSLSLSLGLRQQLF